MFASETGCFPEVYVIESKGCDVFLFGFTEHEYKQIKGWLEDVKTSLQKVVSISSTYAT